MTLILFLCSGNTCRSPMAEAVARHLLERNNQEDKSDIQVISAGIRALPDHPTTPETVNTLAALGIDFTGRSRCLTPELMEQADFIYGMTREHMEVARSMLPTNGNRSSQIILAVNPQSEIKDPIGLGQAAYDKIGEEFIHLIPERLKQIGVLAEKNNKSQKAEIG